jgi:phosphatidylglycerophosphatase A
MNLRDKTILFFATGGYVGKVPFAPGTFGTLVGIPLCFGLSLLSTPECFSYAALLIIALILFAVWVAEEAVNILDAKDPGCIVIDEIAGFTVTMIGVQFSLTSVVCAFFIFRFFDILKPFPVKFLEDKIPGGAGVVLDDVAAGVMANIVLQIILAVAA